MFYVVALFLIFNILFKKVVKISDECSGLVVEYRTRYREVAGSTTQPASYPQRDGK